MATFDTTQRLSGLKECLVTNWTVPLKLLGDTSVLLVTQRYTRIAAHAVEIVLSQSFADAAYSAVGAMVDVLFWVVFPKIACTQNMIRLGA